MSILRTCLYATIGVGTAFLVFACAYLLMSYIEKHVFHNKILIKYQIAFSVGILTECLVLIAGYFILI